MLSMILEGDLISRLGMDLEFRGEKGKTERTIVRKWISPKLREGQKSEVGGLEDCTAPYLQSRSACRCPSNDKM